MMKASNNDIKLLRKLNRKKYREKEQAFVVEGERAVEQVMDNGFVEVQNIFVAERLADSLDTGRFNSGSVKIVEDTVFDEITDTENTQGILALCKIPAEAGLEQLKGEQGVILATDAIQDPGNMGTIIRTAAWFGVKGILAGKGSVDVYHPKVVRSTAGATGSLPLIQGELKDMLPEFEAAGWKVLLLDGGEGADSLHKNFSFDKTLLVVGNEANGIGNELMIPSRKKVKIESASKEQPVESLNAAIAVSIALYSVCSE